MIVYLQLDQNELNPSNPDSNVKAREGAIVMKKDRVRLGRGTNAKEKDLISHFIMRAAFAFTKGDQVKFIERESRLLSCLSLGVSPRFRLNCMKNMEKALQSSGYTPTTVTTETMKELFGNSKFNHIRNVLRKGFQRRSRDS